MAIKKILVPMDYSREALQALQCGMSVAEKNRARVILLHVIPKAVEAVYLHVTNAMHPTSSDNGERPASMWTKRPFSVDLERKARAELHLFAFQHLRGRAPVQLKVAVGKAADEILRVAREEEVDLIVMGTHGCAAARHLPLGRVAAEVTQQAPCPVFTMRHGETGDDMPPWQTMDAKAAG